MHLWKQCVAKLECKIAAQPQLPCLSVSIANELLFIMYGHQSAYTGAKSRSITAVTPGCFVFSNDRQLQLSSCKLVQCPVYPLHSWDEQIQHTISCKPDPPS